MVDQPQTALGSTNRRADYGVVFQKVVLPQLSREATFVLTCRALRSCVSWTGALVSPSMLEQPVIISRKSKDWPLYIVESAIEKGVVGRHGRPYLSPGLRLFPKPLVPT